MKKISEVLIPKLDKMAQIEMTIDLVGDFLAFLVLSIMGYKELLIIKGVMPKTLQSLTGAEASTDCGLLVLLPTCLQATYR